MLRSADNTLILRVMEDASLSLPAQTDSLPPADADGSPAPGSRNPRAKAEHRLALPPALPLILNARDLLPPETMRPAGDLRLAQVPAQGSENKTQLLKKEANTKGSAVLRGIKDLQQLQKQTIAVLEAVKGSLDDIAQVLRSPEATRGMEKQQNAATLLAKGFAREAIEQAQGAAALLPANPETHLLLSLSLAADQQFEHSLAAARKGIALFDRRTHPLAIEAGLLHALAALGCGGEAIDRWTQIIDTLPLPLLFDHLGRIASCFPTELTGGGEALLDDLINRRLARDDQNPVIRDPVHRRRTGTVHIRPDEIPAATLFNGLDAAKDFKLPNAHRAILGLIARRLQLVNSADTSAGGAVSATGEVEIGGSGGALIRFLTECVVPLGNRGLERTADSLGRAAVRKMHRLHADAMTLHRALGKLEMAGARSACEELRATLAAWRKAGNKVVAAHRALRLSLLLMLTGLAVLACVLWPMGGLAGKTPMTTIGPWTFQTIFAGPAILLLGALWGGVTLLRRTWEVPLPDGRAPLTGKELAYLNAAAVRQSLRG